MYILDYLEQFKDKRVKLFVDMDGVIADYDFGKPRDYDKKRPLFDSIKKLEAVSKLPNIELYIFTATRYNDGIEQKYWWLEQYAPFFEKEKIIILSREANNMTDSSTLKTNYLKDFERDGSVMIVIEDDPKNMAEIHESNEDVILLKDTVLVD